MGVFFVLHARNNPILSATRLPCYLRPVALRPQVSLSLPLSKWVLLHQGYRLYEQMSNYPNPRKQHGTPLHPGPAQTTAAHLDLCRDWLRRQSVPFLRTWTKLFNCGNRWITSGDGEDTPLRRGQFSTVLANCRPEVGEVRQYTLSSSASTASANGSCVTSCLLPYEWTCRPRPWHQSAR